MSRVMRVAAYLGVFSFSLACQREQSPILNATVARLDESFALSPNGDLVAKAVDNKLHLLDTDTRKEISCFECLHGYGRATLLFSPKGTLLIAPGCFIDIVARKKLSSSIEVPKDHVFHYTTLSEKLLASAGEPEFGVVVWEISSGKRLQTLKGHKGAIRYLAISHDENKIASSGDDGVLKLWHIPTGKELASLAVPLTKEEVQGISGRPLPSNLPRSVAFSPDDKVLAVVYSGGFIVLWDLDSGKEKRRLNNAGFLIKFSGDGSLLVSVESASSVSLRELGGILHVWETERYQQKSFDIRHKGQICGSLRLAQVNNLIFYRNVDNEQIWTLYEDGVLKKWDVGSISWLEPRKAMAAIEKQRREEEKKLGELIEAENRKYLQELPDLLRTTCDQTELREILAKLHSQLPGSTPDQRQKFDTPSAWRDELITELEKKLAVDDDEVRRLAAGCLLALPSKRVTEIVFDAIRTRKPFAIHLISAGHVKGGGFVLLDPKRPTALSLEQQRAIVPGLIEIIENEPLNWSAQEVLSKIPDQRVLPFFFKRLDLEIVDDPRLQQRVWGDTRGFLHRIFIEYKLSDHIPTDKRDFAAMPPERSAELWRAWYKEYGQRLVWDEASKKYQLKR